MTKSRFKSGKVQDEPGSSYCAKKIRTCLKNYGNISKGHGKRA